MNDLDRDGLDALEGRVLASAKRDVPSPAARARALDAALAALPPVPVPPPPPGAGGGLTAKALLAPSFVTKGVVAIVAVAAIVGAWSLSRSIPENGPVVPSTASVATNLDAATVPSSAPEAPLPRTEAPPEPPSATTRAATSASPGASGPGTMAAPSAAPVGDALGRELRAVDEASAALRAGRAGRCLELLDAYDRAFPRGALRVEADILRLEALVREGRQAEAERLGDALSKRSDTKSYHARILKLLGRPQ